MPQVIAQVTLGYFVIIRSVDVVIARPEEPKQSYTQVRLLRSPFRGSLAMTVIAVIAN